MNIIQKLKELKEKKQKTLITDSDVLEKPSYTISYSEYSTYVQCPHKWFLSYQLKFPSDASEELLFGSATHDTIEQLLTNKKLSNMAKYSKGVAHSVFKEELEKQISQVVDIDLLNKIKKNKLYPIFLGQGKKVFDELDLFKRFPEYDIVEIECKLDGLPVCETKDIKVLFKGFIDLVLKNKKTGRYLILDWKTSGRAWNIAKKEENENFDDQLMLYKYYYSIKRNIDINLIDTCFFNLPRMDSTKVKEYKRELNTDKVLTFKKKFSETCEKIFEFNIFALDKAKHVTKKNFCYRCKYNTDELCNDDEQYQTVDINLKEKYDN